MIKKADFLMLCPFHEEKTPSFSVDAQNKTFYCFGCGKKGTIKHSQYIEDQVSKR